MSDKIREEIKIVRRVARLMPESVEAWAIINVAYELERFLDLVKQDAKAENDA